ncbi:MAG TPA: hypothetical protein VHF69_02300 [Candidatus Synoicihabitans sp.]|nr:hypothetical protein [Candidatus Synoicihabitans sp.]
MKTHLCSRERGSLLAGLLVALVAGAILVMIGIANLVTLSRDAHALRRALVATDGVEAELRVQGSVGPVLIHSARLVLRLIDDVPTEARQALTAVRDASVAVYQLRDAATPEAHAALAFAGIDAMERRGWKRTVLVRENSDTVMVFTPVERGSRSALRVCVAVCSGRELVIVDATVSPEALAELAAPHLPDLRSI